MIEEEQKRQQDLERLRQLRPIDDDFMRCLFKDNIPLAELVLRIITVKRASEKDAPPPSRVAQGSMRSAVPVRMMMKKPSAMICTLESFAFFPRLIAECPVLFLFRTLGRGRRQGRVRAGLVEVGVAVERVGLGELAVIAGHQLRDRH